MGLWLLSGHCLCASELDWPTGWSVHGALPQKGGSSVWTIALHCHPTGEWERGKDSDGMIDTDFFFL